MISIFEAAALLRKADRVLVVTHVRPDGDAAGSGCSLCLALRKLGKTAYLAPNPSAMVRYDKYLLPYRAPADFAPDFITAVDTPSAKQFPPGLERLSAVTDLALDHHGSNSGYARATYLEPDSAATGEIIFELLPVLDVRLDADIAEALYAAVSTDTNCFRTRGTTPRTLRIAAALRETGFDAYGLTHRLFEVRSAARLRLEAALFAGMRFPEPDVCVMVLPYETVVSCGAVENDMDKLSVLTLAPEGAETGILLRGLSDGTWKVTVRTDGRVHAGRIAACLGGGGHTDAAGAVIAGDPAALIASLLSALRSARENG